MSRINLPTESPRIRHGESLNQNGNKRLEQNIERAICVYRLRIHITSYIQSITDNERQYLIPNVRTPGPAKQVALKRNLT